MLPPWNNTLGRRTVKQQQMERKKKEDWKVLIASIIREALPDGLDGPVAVEFRQHFPSVKTTVTTKTGTTYQRKREFPDVDSMTRCSKWILDGITQAGAWPDDCPLWMTAARFEQHVVDGTEGISIRFIPSEVPAWATPSP